MRQRAFCGNRPVMRLVVLFLGVVLAALAAGVVGCGPQCRDIDTQPVNIVCESPPRFTGEAHFDSAATFETFLSQQCLYTAGDTAVQSVIDDIDFTTSAVFVAVGPAALDNSRCLETRELDKAQVCTDGLKVYFQDVFQRADTGCPGPRWTVAFTLLREDLRAALDAADNAQ